MARDAGDDQYSGIVRATFVDFDDIAVSRFIRHVHSQGDNNDVDRDFNAFSVPPAGGQYRLRITAVAAACSTATVGGAVALIRID